VNPDRRRHQSLRPSASLTCSKSLHATWPLCHGCESSGGASRMRLSRIDVASLSHSLPVKSVSACHMLSRVVRVGFLRSAGTPKPCGPGRVKRPSLCRVMKTEGDNSATFSYVTELMGHASARSVRFRQAEFICSHISCTASDQGAWRPLTAVPMVWTSCEILAWQPHYL
jgi:hypothetical protein